MSIKYKNKPIYKILLFLILLLSIFLLLPYISEKTPQISKRTKTSTFPHQIISTPKLSETPQFMKTDTIPPLSIQQTQLLEELITEAKEYTDKIINGKIEFSVTLYMKSPSEPENFFKAVWESVGNRLTAQHEKQKNSEQTYDSEGKWDITYRFDKDFEFFDIKAVKNREMNYRLITIHSQDGQIRKADRYRTHHQFLRHKEQTLYIRVGAQWKPYDQWLLSQPVTTDVPDFYERYNPFWWQLGYTTNFETFIQNHNPTVVKMVNMNGIPQVYLQVYQTGQVESTSWAETIELLMHPNTGIHPKRILIGYRRASMQPEVEENWFATPTPIPGKFTYAESVNYVRITSELTQYEPGIWFPKTVTEEELSGASLSKLFPELPRSEYPVIMDEELLPDWFIEELQGNPFWKRVMTVHRAAFNIPNLHITNFNP